MAILTSDFNDLVKNAIVKWREGYESVPKAAEEIYDVYMTETQTSEHSQIDGAGFAKRKVEGGRYKVGSPVQGYTLNLSQTRIGLTEAVTWEMRKYDKYREIDKAMRKLGESTRKRMELDLTHQLTFGVGATSYTNLDGETISCASADGQQIIDTDHTITGGSSTFSNKITSAFSRAGLESAEDKFTQMFDNNGVKVTVKPDTIITGDDPTVVNAVREFISSQGAPDTANRADNIYKGKYKHLVLPYLATDANGAYDSTKKNYWFLADLSHTDAVCEISESPTFVPPKMGGNGEDYDTDDWNFKSSASYDYGFLDIKFIVGSTGAA